MSVLAPPGTQWTRWGLRRRRTDARVGTEMRKPICDKATPVEMMCAAARADSESASRCDGHFWSPA